MTRRDQMGIKRHILPKKISCSSRGEKVAYIVVKSFDQKLLVARTRQGRRDARFGPRPSLELVPRHGYSLGRLGRFDENALGRLPKGVITRRALSFHFQLPVDRTPVHVPADGQEHFRLRKEAREEAREEARLDARRGYNLHNSMQGWETGFSVIFRLFQMINQL